MTPISSRSGNHLKGFSFLLIHISVFSTGSCGETYGVTHRSTTGIVMMVIVLTVVVIVSFTFFYWLEYGHAEALPLSVFWQSIFVLSG